MKRDGQGTVENSIERSTKSLWKMAVSGINRYAALIEGDDAEDGDEGRFDIGKQRKDLCRVWVGIRTILDKGRTEWERDVEDMRRALIRDIENDCKEMEKGTQAGETS